MKFTLLGISILLFCCNCLAGEGIYWRDYTGTIPEDAVPGGYDANGGPTYIGQGYMKDSGIFPGIIYPGKKEITVSYKGIKVLNTYIKILCCSNPDNLEWVPTKSDTLRSSTIYQYLAKGGNEVDKQLYIGREVFEGKLTMGKVIVREGKYILYYVPNKKEVRSESYEVLTYTTEDD